MGPLRSLKLGAVALAMVLTLAAQVVRGDADVDDSVSVYYRPEMVVASYCIACLGSVTALQAMKQRTGLYGTRNWLLLLAGSTSLAAVGIWSMHFIGMQSLVLHDAAGNRLEMAFGAGLTIGSLLVAIVIITVGFTLAGDPKTPKLWRTCGVGVIGGLGVAVMHYMGMLAMVSQATIHWSAGVIVASVIVGIVAATAALLIFFHLNHLWQDDMRLQILTAMIMGVAVNAMHYTGMVAASWHLSDSVPDFSSYATSTTLTTVIVVLATTTSFGLLGILWWNWRRMKLLRTLEGKKTQCLILSILVRNSQGKILTTLTSTLPSVVIDHQHTGQNTFTRLSPDFLRFLKISFNWTNLARYQRHLAKLHASGTITQSSMRLFDGFIGAAQQLSGLLGIPLDHLGFLYYQPTGNMVTLVVKANHANSLTCDPTTLRWMQPAAMRTALLQYQLPADVDPLAFLDDVRDYQRRVLLPLTGEVKRDELLNDLLREVANELVLDKDRVEEEIREWREVLGKYVHTRHHLSLLARNERHWDKVSLAPMVKAQLDHFLASEEVEAAAAALLAATANNQATKEHQQLKDERDAAANGTAGANAPVSLFLSLMFVQVTPTGLRVMLHRDGPLGMIPLVKLNQQHVVTSRELEMLRDGVTATRRGGGLGGGVTKMNKSSKEQPHHPQVSTFAPTQSGPQPGLTTPFNTTAPGGAAGLEGELAYAASGDVGSSVVGAGAAMSGPLMLMNLNGGGVDITGSSGQWNNGVALPHATTSASSPCRSASVNAQPCTLNRR